MTTRPMHAIFTTARLLGFISVAAQSGRSKAMIALPQLDLEDRGPH